MRYEKMLIIFTSDLCILQGGGVTSLEAFSTGAPIVTYPNAQTVVQLAAGMYRKVRRETTGLK
jgi:hypothetical protein